MVSIVLMNNSCLTEKGRFITIWDLIRVQKEENDETNIPAQQIEAGSHTWIQSADGHERRPSGLEAPSRQGPGEADAVVRCAVRSRPRITTQNPANRGNSASDASTG